MQPAKEQAHITTGSEKMKEQYYKSERIALGLESSPIMSILFMSMILIMLFLCSHTQSLAAKNTELIQRNKLLADDKTVIEKTQFQVVGRCWVS